MPLYFLAFLGEVWIGGAKFRHLHVSIDRFQPTIGIVGRVDRRAAVGFDRPHDLLAGFGFAIGGGRSIQQQFRQSNIVVGAIGLHRSQGLFFVERLQGCSILSGLENSPELIYGVANVLVIFRKLAAENLQGFADGRFGVCEFMLGLEGPGQRFKSKRSFRVPVAVQAAVHVDRLARHLLGFYDLSLSDFQIGVSMQQIRLVGKLLAALAGDRQRLLGDALGVFLAAGGPSEDMLQDFQGMEEGGARDAAPR